VARQDTTATLDAFDL